MIFADPRDEFVAKRMRSRKEADLAALIKVPSEIEDPAMKQLAASVFALLRDPFAPTTEATDAFREMMRRNAAEVFQMGYELGQRVVLERRRKSHKKRGKP